MPYIHFADEQKQRTAYAVAAFKSSLPLSVLKLSRNSREMNYSLFYELINKKMEKELKNFRNTI